MPDTEDSSPGLIQLQSQTANNLPPPEKFSGANSPQQAELWSKWFCRFERYWIASGLKHKPDIEQVGTLLYSMGECADDILKTLNIDEEKASYDEVKNYETMKSVATCWSSVPNSIKESKNWENLWISLYKTYTDSRMTVSMV